MRRSETLTEKVYRLLNCTAVQEAVPNPVQSGYVAYLLSLVRAGIGEF